MPLLPNGTPIEVRLCSGCLAINRAAIAAKSQCAKLVAQKGACLGDSITRFIVRQQQKNHTVIWVPLESNRIANATRVLPQFWYRIADSACKSRKPRCEWSLIAW